MTANEEDAIVLASMKAVQAAFAQQVAVLEAMGLEGEWAERMRRCLASSDEHVAELRSAMNRPDAPLPRRLHLVS